MAAHRAPPSLGFSRQGHWSGLPFPPPMHESEKWKGIRSVVSDSSQPPGLQPTRLLHPWDFQGKSTGVGRHGLRRTFNSGQVTMSTIMVSFFTFLWSVISHQLPFWFPKVFSFLSSPISIGEIENRNGRFSSLTFETIPRRAIEIHWEGRSLQESRNHLSPHCPNSLFHWLLFSGETKSHSSPLRPTGKFLLFLSKQLSCGCFPFTEHGKYCWFVCKEWFKL